MVILFQQIGMLGDSFQQIGMLGDFFQQIGMLGDSFFSRSVYMVILFQR
ncbi:hypothetical protein [Butyrivibrio sp. JL13D10]